LSGSHGAAPSEIESSRKENRVYFL